MWNRIGVALGAGIASALLFAVTIQGTAIALALAYLAPLPIMIATLGWGLDAGAIAFASGTAVVAGAVDPMTALGFALTVALPSLALAGLAALKDIRIRRTPPDSPAQRAGLGHLAMLAAGIGVAISAGALITMIVANGGYEKGVAGVSQWLQPELEGAMNEAGSLPNGVTGEALAQLIVKFAPPAIAGSATLMLLINLYLSARSAQLSQRLPRPWPDIPTNLALPAPLAGLALASLAVWAFAPAPVSAFASILCGALAVLFALLGLAVLHALTRRAPARIALIGALYLACGVAPHWVLPPVAAIGLIESFVGLRARSLAPPRPKPETRTPKT